MFKNFSTSPSIELEGGIVGTQIGIKTRGAATQIDAVNEAVASLVPEN